MYMRVLDGDNDSAGLHFCGMNSNSNPNMHSRFHCGSRWQERWTFAPFSCMLISLHYARLGKKSSGSPSVAGVGSSNLGDAKAAEQVEQGTPVEIGCVGIGTFCNLGKKSSSSVPGVAKPASQQGTQLITFVF